MDARRFLSVALFVSFGCYAYVGAETLGELRARAESGDAKAQNRLGTLYHNGDVVRKDYAEAFKWKQKAAGQNDADAQYDLGALYAFGLGIPKDDSEAFKWVRKAAEQKHARAQNHLGVMYH